MVLHTASDSQGPVQHPEESEFDLLVIGGGINGAGIAADAAGRGLRVLLCDKGDLAGGTSSASTKLIHGGLRYLEYFEFRLVREALMEREVLLGMAPHVIWPLRFRLPHRPGVRPRWMVRVGLGLYDLLGGRRNTLPASRAINMKGDGPLREEWQHGFEYSDCWVDDARLVVLNAMMAHDHGADIRSRVACTGLRQMGRGWVASLRSAVDGRTGEVTARAVINAAGPWVDQVTDTVGSPADGRGVRLVRGSHIVVRRLYEGEHAYMFQHSDRRVIFVIPYENDFTLIGTTEVDCTGDPGQAHISGQEVEYLLEAVNSHFRVPITADQVCHSFSGVRPLMEEENASATSLSRDYHLTFTRQPAPFLTVYGGKITTYRRLAEAAMFRLGDVFVHMGDDWTADTTLPGGDFDSPSGLLTRYRSLWPWLPDQVLRRWVRSYGTCALDLVGDASAIEDMGRDFGAGLYEREVRYLQTREWALRAEDVLWRRTKIGLHMTADEASAFRAWMEGAGPGQGGQDA
ncbi:MAG: glycerol-3-phosphate dehydrogenase [Pseudomonadota bacterium]